jgi:hypothetical protein
LQFGQQGPLGRQFVDVAIRLQSLADGGGQAAHLGRAQLRIALMQAAQGEEVVGRARPVVMAMKLMR